MSTDFDVVWTIYTAKNMYFKFSTRVFKSESLLREVLFEVLKAIQAFLLQTFC